ncbi:hypothetical protein ACWEOE_12155 [Amycolatopsis sp. NPDC004368]
MALVFFPWSTAFAVRWVRRWRAARRSRWVPVTRTAASPEGAHQVLTLHVDGSTRLKVRTFSMLPGRYTFLQRPEPRHAWLGGEGRGRVLVIERRALPYPIPVRSV